MGNASLPAWARRMADLFRSGTVSQFILSGNIHDEVPCPEKGQARFLPLKRFLAEVLFAQQEVVLFYNRGQGIQLAKGGERFFKYLQVFDRFHGSRFAADSGAAGDRSRLSPASGLAKALLAPAEGSRPGR